jgi:Derlin-2/3
MLPLYIAAILFKIYSLHGIYTFVLYYLIGKKHRNMIFFINIVPIRAPYLAWYLLFLNWVVRKLDITENLISIFVGHTFYYFTKISPELPFSNKVNYLDTPEFL